MGFDSGIASFAPFVTRGTSLPRTQPKPRVPHGMHSVSPNKIFSRLRSRVCCSSCPHPTSPSRALRVGASSRLETMRPGDEALRVLYITLEFRAGAFSGNGVYAQSQARALGRAGHRVLVVCGTPDAPDSASAPDLVSPDLVSPDLVSVVALPVPSSKWVVSTSTPPGVRSRTPRARAPISSPRSARSTRTSSSAWTGPHSRRGTPSAPPSIRHPTERSTRSIRHRSCTPTSASSHARTPRTSPPSPTPVAAAAAVVALSRRRRRPPRATTSPSRVALAPRIILPLRDDVRKLALATDPTPNDAAPRRYLDAACRDSPREGTGSVSSALVEALERRGALRADDDGIVPLLCASTSGTYADTVRDRFRAVASRVGGAVRVEFLGRVASPSRLRGQRISTCILARATRTA